MRGVKLTESPKQKEQKVRQEKEQRMGSSREACKMGGERKVQCLRCRMQREDEWVERIGEVSRGVCTYSEENELYGRLRRERLKLLLRY